MERAAVVTLLVLFATREVHAKCVYRAPYAFSGRVKSCKVVDTNDPALGGFGGEYRGLFLVLADGKGQDVKGWIPEREGATCGALRAGATLKATMSFACCDGDPNPPCYIGTANIFTEVEGAKGAPLEQPAPSSAPVVTAPPATSAPATAEATTRPSASASNGAVVSSEPAPGSRNCGCRVIGGGAGGAGLLALAAAAVAMGLRRRRRRPRTR